MSSTFLGLNKHSITAHVPFTDEIVRKKQLNYSFLSKQLFINGFGKVTERPSNRGRNRFFFHLIAC